MGLFDRIKANRAAGKGIFGKQGGFGSGHGQIAKTHGFGDYAQPVQQGISPQQRRAEHAIGQGEGIVSSNYTDLVGQDNTGIKGPTDTGIGSEFLHTANIDFNDRDQIMKLQRALGVKEDGIFGPKTEAAYRGAINARRSGAGFGEYEYDNLLENSINQNAGPDLGLNAQPDSMSAQEFEMRFPNVNYQDKFAGEFGNYQWDADNNQFMLPEGVLDQLDWDNQFQPPKGKY